MPSSPSNGPPAWHIAAVYGFATINDPEGLCAHLEGLCASAGLRGTLLIAPEGVNGTLAGNRSGLDSILATLAETTGAARLEVKRAQAETAPFHRLKVRVKREIVTMGRPDLDPAHRAGTYVEPGEWNALISDPDTVVIDTRNDYEVAVGTFEGAVDPRTPSFRDFPDWFEREGRALLAERGRAARVAMFCTGGIRCEKATALLRSEGVDEVFHLKGGILNYLETVPEAESLWRGECFVFDERVAVGHGLEAGSHTLCRGCRMPVSAEGRRSPLYVEGVCCDRCHDRDPARQAGYAERQRQVQIAATRGIEHVGARLTPPQPLPLLDVEPSGGEGNPTCVRPND